jgi:hypothetical protein
VPLQHGYKLKRLFHLMFVQQIKNLLIARFRADVNLPAAGFSEKPHVLFR